MPWCIHISDLTLQEMV